MKIKTGDNVKVLSGKDRNKTGKVVQVLQNRKNNEWYVVVEGANLLTKHIRAQRGGEKGQKIELPAPIHVSKVMLIDPKSSKPTRVAYTFEGTTKKRTAKKSGEILD